MADAGAKRADQTAALPLCRAMFPQARGRLADSHACSSCLQLCHPNPVHPVLDNGRLASICKGVRPQGWYLVTLPPPDIVCSACGAGPCAQSWTPSAGQDPCRHHTHALVSSDCCLCLCPHPSCLLASLGNGLHYSVLSVHTCTLPVWHLPGARSALPFRQITARALLLAPEGGACCSNLAGVPPAACFTGFLCQCRHLASRCLWPDQAGGPDQRAEHRARVRGQLAAGQQGAGQC